VPDGVRIVVQIMPNAKKTDVMGVLDDALKIRLQAQPIEGRANDALVRYIADTLDVARSAVVITHGLTNKRKILELRSKRLTVETVMRALHPQATD
jgi:uncharacterized protein (TIGR00251 family)